MQQEAEKFAEEDRKRKELIEAKNKLETLAYATEKIIKEQADKLSDEEKQKLQELVDQAKELKAKEDATKEEVDKKFEELQNALTPIYQKIGGQTPPPNQAGGTTDGTTPPPQQ